MCGIAGLWHWGGQARLAPTVLPAMLRALQHRGPDDAGQEAAGIAALGATRLSIVDLAGGHQPITSRDGQLVVAQNGEIYNYPALHAELAAAGHSFRTRCDTEVLLHGYQQWGLAGLVERLQGMYAFAVADARQQALYLVRDRLGIKPLYLVTRPDGGAYASEIGALLAAGQVSTRLDQAALQRTLLYQFTPGEQTVLAEVRRVPPGTWVEIRDGAVRTQTYWRLGDLPPAAAADPAELVEQTTTLLRETVRSHLMADVPLGVFLSGGLDSSLVAALTQELVEQPVRTFSIGFAADSGLDESPWSQQVAAHLGTRHTAQRFEAADLLAALDGVVRHCDEPCGDPALLPTYLLARLARQQVTVVLTGEGADELFAGYDHYPSVVARAAEPAWRTAARRLRDGLRGGLRRLRGGCDPAEIDPRSGFPLTAAQRTVRRLLPGGPADLLWRPEDPRLAGPARSLQAALRGDLAAWLPDDLLMKVDKMTMAHSLEARVPFLDHRVVEAALALSDAARLRAGQNKWVLRQVATRLLPAAVVQRGKHGFNLPLAAWLRGPLATLLQDSVRSPAVGALGLDAAYLQRLAAEHVAGRLDLARLLWTTLMLLRWHDTLPRSAS
ncbi:MAG: asparagine synthase (glutamine-hydrolyzing) [Fimbriimonadaceae bacterium]|nr:asparagine synthase (glutamine-hydrolyzing) [Fimbriimonadaceae bacterium]